MKSGQIPFSIPSVSLYNSFVPSPSKDGKTCVALPAFRNVTNPCAKRPSEVTFDMQLNRICKEFSYESLSKATEGFRNGNIIGKGSFGAVFRGELDDQTEIAVKVLKDSDVNGFMNEVKIMSKFRHPNLVILLGFAVHSDERLLVYERMEDGDCEKRLKTPSLRAQFGWKVRLSILADCCRGIAFMVDSSPVAFHRDIKPSNMMLDKHGAGKMTDFGLACELVSKYDTMTKVSNAAGTIGYACPNYIKSGIVSEASEIYSFGICILEFLTNQPPAVINPSSNQVVYLLDTLGGRITSLIAIADAKAGWPAAVAEDLGKLVFCCCDREQENRPKFNQVSRALCEILNRGSSGVEIRLGPNRISGIPGSKAPEQRLIPLSPSRPLQPSQQISGASRLESSRLDRNRARFEISSRHGENTKTVVMPLDLNTAPCIVGRNMNELIQLPEKYRLSISRAHFSISKSEDDKYRILNLSGNGTLVEGNHLEEGKLFLASKGDSCEICNQGCVKLCSNTKVPFLELRFITT